jgi:hypothetical protein
MSCAKAISTPQTLAYLSTTTGDALIDATAHPLIARIVAFLTGIGLHVEQATVPDDTFLPGIQIDSGRLLYDETRLRYPGDLLHEAGHLAVMLPNQRERAGANVTDAPADEMMAIGWSYAAALQQSCFMQRAIVVARIRCWTTSGRGAILACRCCNGSACAMTRKTQRRQASRPIRIWCDGCAPTRNESRPNRIAFCPL